MAKAWKIAIRIYSNCKKKPQVYKSYTYLPAIIIVYN